MLERGNSEMKLFVFPYLVLEADLLVRRWTASQDNSPFFWNPMFRYCALLFVLSCLYS